MTDILAPPDYIIGSPMGYYNGDVYNNYLQRIYAGENTFKRVSWYSEIKPPDAEELEKLDRLRKNTKL